MNKKQKSLTNKGFSLVELIIVIAIMAVLVGVLAPQYIKYLDKSKISADKQLTDSIRQAMTTTMLDPEIKDAPAKSSNGDIIGGSPATIGATGYWHEVYSILGVKDAAALAGEYKYASPNSVKYTVDANGSITVAVQYGTTADSTVDFTIQ
ncbi:MAG: prepilin-type N-terminal cleavage/methylation domain-containing protein [Lachnospiraceae bacterium]|nr:prepilin-type N-terminal cleavage/methylation domain-containing protein [Lachnospiraceae bacterium]